MQVPVSQQVEPSVRDVQAGVDAVLARNGAYVPLELLLTLGWLRYPDYKDWRHGRQSRLQAVLTPDLPAVAALLETAADWAEKLGLEAQRRSYFGGRHAVRKLEFFDADWRVVEAQRPSAVRCKNGMMDKLALPASSFSSHAPPECKATRPFQQGR